MNLKRHFKEFMNNWKDNLKIFLLFFFLSSFVFLGFIINSKDDSAMKLLISIFKILKYRFFFFALIIIFQGMLLQILIHEVFKLISLEKHNDMRRSFKTSYVLTLIILLVYLLNTLALDQFNLLITILGLPILSVYFLPEKFMQFLKKKVKKQDQFKKSYHPRRKFH
ncbi:hypothetical protein [Streptococcus tangpeifui]|uniref:hypothetical protein n=1 Tax=Streptococcus tangpeifui TaxID=2709400 RepID=UPI0013EDB952|nr:hypothetical protein [Streptococcus sp. ZJ373]